MILNDADNIVSPKEYFLAEKQKQSSRILAAEQENGFQ
jgi:hypothetical protein